MPAGDPLAAEALNSVMMCTSLSAVHEIPRGLSLLLASLTPLLIHAPMLQIQHTVRRDFFGHSNRLGVQKRVAQQCRRQTVVRAEDKPVDAKIER